jgi:hypothetical protein
MVLRSDLLTLLGTRGGAHLLPVGALFGFGHELTAVNGSVVLRCRARRGKCRNE